MGLSLQPKHLARYLEIARLLIKYGRSDLVSELDIDGLGSEESDAPVCEDATQLAADLEALGPTFIKLGQLLSTRVDLLPAPYTDALSRLQDNVAAFEYEEVERIVAEELGVKISHAFEPFDQTPLAAASLAQVHRATLHSGRDVVVKVQRPGIRKQIAEDMAALGELAEFADAHTEVVDNSASPSSCSSSGTPFSPSLTTRRRPTTSPRSQGSSSRGHGSSFRGPSRTTAPAA